MKKLFFVLLMAFLFAGCRKVADNNPAIVGKWKITQELAIYYVNSVEVYRESLVLSQYGVGTDSYTEFKADGTVIDYGFHNNSYTTSTGTYTITNGELIITVNGSSTNKGPITFVNNNSITMSSTYQGTGTTSYNNNGIFYSANGETVIVSFTRL